MVHVRDEGSEFDAPVTVVWKYLQSGGPHAEAHKSIRNRESKPAGEGVMVATMERHWRGNWVKVTNRLTMVPPVGYVTEQLEGPFAGSRMFIVYTPVGQKTRVDVFGEFSSTVVPPGELESAARAWLAESFDEDAPAVRVFAEG